MRENEILLFETSFPGKHKGTQTITLIAYATSPFWVYDEEGDGYPIGSFQDFCQIRIVDPNSISGWDNFDIRYLEIAEWLLTVLPNAIKAIENYDNPEAVKISKREHHDFTW